MANEQEIDYERLRGEVIVLSCYLKAQQMAPSQSHPDGGHLEPFCRSFYFISYGDEKNL